MDSSKSFFMFALKQLMINSTLNIPLQTSELNVGEMYHFTSKNLNCWQRKLLKVIKSNFAVFSILEKNMFYKLENILRLNETKYNIVLSLEIGLFQ